MSCETSSTNNSKISVVALVPAAGSSARFGGALPKVFHELAGKPVLRRTVEVLHAHPAIRAVIVMCRAEDMLRARELLTGLSKVTIIEGGSTRQESVARGLRYASEHAALSPSELVLVHDAARCLVTDELVQAAIMAAACHGAATLAIPCSDTVVRVTQREALACVSETLPREDLRAVQTPQVFRAELLMRAHTCAESSATDDASLVARFAPVALVAGEARNIKITLPHDLEWAETLLH